MLILKKIPIEISCEVFIDSEIYGYNYGVSFDFIPSALVSVMLAWVKAKVH